MPKNKDEVIRKYQGIELGACSYLEDSIFDTGILADFDEVHGILREVLSNESYLQKKGYEFLEEYYGFENLAQMLSESEVGGVGEDLETKEDIYNWLVEKKSYAENYDSDD